MSDELAKARADLADVTPGPWPKPGTSSTVYMDGTGIYHIRTEGVPGVRGTLTVTRPDAEHIGRYDPLTVAALLDLAELWERQLSLGTTQGGGRQYDEHARQHTEARVLLARFYDLIGDDDE
jgi:hypothetical protein